MSPEERSTFEVRMQADDDLRQEVEASQLIVEGLQGDLEDQQLALQFEQFYASVREGAQKQGTAENAQSAGGKVIPFFNLRRLSVAAAIVAALLAGWLLVENSGIFSGDDQPRMADEAGELYEVPLRSLGGGLGFTPSGAQSSTLAIRIVTDSPEYQQHYRFTDSLTLFLDAAPQPSDSLTLLFDPVSEQYLMNWKGGQYPLNVGFEKVFPLEKMAEDE